MNREEVRAYVNQYCKLRDIQYAAYELHARKHNLTAKELFVLDIIWFAEDGCLQSEICERLTATKQTVSAIIKKFWKLGHLSMIFDAKWQNFCVRKNTYANASISTRFLTVSPAAMISLP